MSARAGTTADAFLGGEVTVIQPGAGHHRAGLEAVLLAAALPASFAGRAVDLGAGSGAAGFCLAARCPGATVLLVEREQELTDLAARALSLPANCAIAGRVGIAEVDLAAPEAAREAAGFPRGAADAVLMNPPFYDRSTVRSSPSRARAAAHILDDSLADWLRAAAWSLRPSGILIAVVAAPMLAALLAATAGRFGSAAVLPLHPRRNQPAHRLLFRGIKGRKDSVQLLPGLVLHDGDGPTYTPALEAVLRRGEGLDRLHPAWVAA